MAGQVTARGSLGHGGPAARGRRGRAPAARRRHRAARQDARARAGGDGGDRVARVRRDAQPVGPGPHAGGSSGGSAAAVAAGLAAAALGTDGAGSIRIPAGVLRPVRPQAPARPRADGARLERHVGDRRAHARRARLRAVPRRRRRARRRRSPTPRRARPARCGSPTRSGVPRGLTASVDDEQRGAVERTAERLRDLGHSGRGARPRLRQRRRQRDDALPRGRAQRAGARWRIPSGSRARPAGWRAWDAKIPSFLVARAHAQEAVDRERIGALFDEFDVLMTPGVHAPAAADRRVARAARAADAQRDGELRRAPPDLEPHGPARRGRAGRGRAGRLPGRGPARRPRPATRRRCSRSRRSSRPTPAGSRAGRRWPREHAGRAARARDRVAHEAGAELRDAFGRLGGCEISAKSTPTDLVSEADVSTERLIRARLEAARPDDAIMGEEGDDRPGTSGLRWVVDPLDGTVNFLFGIPQWCVSIACRGRRRRARGRRVRPDARRDLGGDARRRRDAGRRAVCARPRATSWPPRSSPPASATTPRCASRRRGSWRGCCRACATCGGSARPRSTSPGPPPAASTPTTSAASSTGTSPRARSSARAPGSPCTSCRRRRRPTRPARRGAGARAELLALVTD